VCELVGADVVEVARGVGLDHRLGPHFFRAGIGFGGSCFPKDVTALKQLAGNSGYPFLLLQAVWEVNELQKRRVVQKLQQPLRCPGLPSSRTPTTCARRRAGSSPTGCSPRGQRYGRGTRSRGRPTSRVSRSATRPSKPSATPMPR